MLTICPTPIGNLQDISARQLKALHEADLIACEDTRVAGKLLELLGISRVDGRPQLMSYHEHNARDRVDELIALMLEGKHVVLISDAGTPTISDPGFRLVREAAEQGVHVSALPGPVAAIVALSASGLPTDRFFFEGFLPAKQAARIARLGVLQQLDVTVLLYESPHRVAATLEDVCAVYGAEHAVCVARELTKQYEEYVRGQAARVLAKLNEKDRLRGEFVIILGPAQAQRQWLAGEALNQRIRDLLSDGMRTKAIRDMLASQVEMASSELYEYIERLKLQDKG